MSSSEQTILCGDCKCPVESVAEPQTDDQVTCPQCGRADSFDQVMSTVKEYIGYLASKHIAKSLADSFGGSGGFIKVSSNQPAYRSFRWECTEVRF